MRTLLFTTAFLALPLLVLAVDPPQQSDADFRQKIVGSWIIDIGRTNEDFWARGTETYYSNGCFVVQATVFSDGKTQLETNAGFWHINEGILIAANTNVAAIQSGALARNYENCKLIRIDDHEMVHYLFRKPMKKTSIVRRRRLE